ncbi:FG-GAP repeat protein [Salinispirillum sp. LH 10-3-1]|uniref:FG-GAP repeat protein n=1 Tax=Salinispirillum sp. LH 10-3-1 TaxID=2952525 RepID=A0AB38YH05_9GAMM
MNKLLLTSALCAATLLVSACNDSSSNNTDSTNGTDSSQNDNGGSGDSGGTGGTGSTTYTISTNVTGPGTISPEEQILTVPDDGNMAIFTITPDSGAGVINVSGCGIDASPFGNNVYWTDTITADCTVEVQFAMGNTVTLDEGSWEDGQFFRLRTSETRFVLEGEATTFDFSPIPNGKFLEAQGCGGSVNGAEYTTAAISSDCTVNYGLSSIIHDLTLNIVGQGELISYGSAPTVVYEDQALPLGIIPQSGWYLASFDGCGIIENDGTPVNGMSFSGPNTEYILPSATAPCTLDVSFAEIPVVNATIVGGNGSINQNNWTVMPGETFSFTASPDVGFSLGSVTGCAGTFANNVFTSEPINAACDVNVSFVQGTTLAVTVESPKTLRFSWQPVTGADEYRLQLSPDGLPVFSTVEIIANDPTPTAEFALINASLPLNIGASYRVRACGSNDGNCTATTSADRVDLTANDLIAGIAQLDPDATATSIQQAFGHAVAVSRDGSTIAVGAPGPMAGTKETGRVSIWRNNSGSWDRLGDIQPPSTANVFEFGYSLALSEDGSTLVVGAPGDTNRARGVFTSQGFVGETLDSESGAAYVFTYNPAQNRFDYRAHFKADPRNGSQQLDTNNAAALNSARFGHSVAINDAGTRIVVGAPGESTEYTGIYTGSLVVATRNDTQGSRSGAAFVYSGANASWNQVLYIKPSDTTRFSGFGWSVASSGDGSTLAIGAPHYQVSGSYSNPERLYVFSTTTPADPNFNWAERGNFNLTGSRNEDLFGSAVAVSQDGNTIAVGAYAAGGFDGAAYIMHKEEMAAWGDAWLEKRSVTPQGLTSSLMNFGYSLALTDDGGKLLVGARTENSDVQGLSSFASPGASNLHDEAGAAFLFSFDASTFTLTEDVLIKAPSPLASRRFGHAAAMSGDASVILIGEPDNALEESNRGRAYLY